jgi:hypothetical protein
MPNTLVERKRIQDIVQSKAGLARPAAAQELAFGSGMSVQAAISLLEKLPAEKAASSIETAMAEVGGLGIRSSHMGGAGYASTGDAKADRLAELRRNLAPVAAARKGLPYRADSQS